MQNLLSPKQIKEQLNQALGDLGNFKQYALLDYPNHSNLGDHLIWLGEMFYVNDVLKAKIDYASDLENFSGELMEKQVGKDAPILLHGGGNLGDLWTDYQKFREQIIATYLDRPIFIFPQTLYFVKESNLEKTAKIFNNHPNLTIFMRDNYSYKIASEAFYNCRVIKAPDMAFQMVDMPKLSFNINKKDSILYLKRKDKESNNLKSQDFNLDNLSIQDWVSYRYYWGYKQTGMPRAWTPKGMVRVLKEGWHQGTYIPLEWLSRQKWNYFHPYGFRLRNMCQQNLHLKSWNMMHHGIYQLKQYPLAIVNRLHGHILSLLLDIPHVFLANSYYKNEAFYETWTARIPFCKFVRDISQVETAVQELLTSFPANQA